MTAGTRRPQDQIPSCRVYLLLDDTIDISSVRFSTCLANPRLCNLSKPGAAAL